jgi:hypothetical protein
MRIWVSVSSIKRLDVVMLRDKGWHGIALLSMNDLGADAVRQFLSSNENAHITSMQLLAESETEAISSQPGHRTSFQPRRCVQGPCPTDISHGSMSPNQPFLVLHCILILLDM